jgi:hypothetical protein
VIFDKRNKKVIFHEVVGASVAVGDNFMKFLIAKICFIELSIL